MFSGTLKDEIEMKLLVWDISISVQCLNLINKIQCLTLISKEENYFIYFYLFSFICHINYVV